MSLFYYSNDASDRFDENRGESNEFVKKNECVMRDLSAKPAPGRQVSLINMAGGRAVGICGKDGNTLRGRVRDQELGFVGRVFFFKIIIIYI